MRAIFLPRCAATLALVLVACAPAPAPKPSAQPLPAQVSWSATPVLGVRDVKTAMDFYTRSLGFRSVVLVPGVNPGEGGVYGIVERSGASLHLQIRRQRGNAERESLEQDAEVRVGDVGTLYEEFARSGVTFVTKTRNGKTSTFGERDFTIQDPDGNRVTFAAGGKP